MNKKTKIYTGIGILIGIVLIYYIFSLAASNQDSCTTKPVTEIDIGGHQNVVSHIHQSLQIEINGETILIPANIGLEGVVMRPIHTHDASGKIHVEGPCPRDFTLGEFFDVWQEEFTETCIIGNCEDETHTLTLYVNGIENTEYRNLVLRDDQKIEIVYEEI
ncbi:MAG TPA: hypothetical protein HA360_00270 [Nanoarchaeota archaeon]|nr:hypothetical protein [Nanoarchaeota archaeon]HII13486.1 hypothetical protein [Nanoarchaeota archaeon]HIJ05575.1 hypothetical protein [Nanoarchaeota archaeon]